MVNYPTVHREEKGIYNAIVFIFYFLSDFSLYIWEVSFRRSVRCLFLSEQSTLTEDLINSVAISDFKRARLPQMRSGFIRGFSPPAQVVHSFPQPSPTTQTPLTSFPLRDLDWHVAPVDGPKESHDTRPIRSAISEALSSKPRPNFYTC